MEPANRQASAEEFGHELQLAQRHNGLTPDSMALSEPSGEPATGGSTSGSALQQQCSFGDHPVRPMRPKRLPTRRAGQAGQRHRRRRPFAHTARSANQLRAMARVPQPADRSLTVDHADRKRNRKRLLIASAAAVVAVLLVVGGVFLVTS